MSSVVIENGPKVKQYVITIFEIWCSEVGQKPLFSLWLNDRLSSTIWKQLTVPSQNTDIILHVYNLNKTLFFI